MRLSTAPGGPRAATLTSLDRLARGGREARRAIELRGREVAPVRFERLDAHDRDQRDLAAEGAGRADTRARSACESARLARRERAGASAFTLSLSRARATAPSPSPRRHDEEAGKRGQARHVVEHRERPGALGVGNGAQLLARCGRCRGEQHAGCAPSQQPLLHAYSTSTESPASSGRLSSPSCTPVRSATRSSA